MAAVAVVAAIPPAVVDVHAPAAAQKLQQQPAFALPPSPPLSDDGQAVQDARLAAIADRARNEPELSSPLQIERVLGETELSYFLPSREDGVNDMYLHLGCTAPARLIHLVRIRAAWALSRLRHPPLAARVRMEPGTYTSARFVYAPPSSVAEALLQAEAALEFSEDNKDALIDRYLNGPRTLSADRLAYLFVGCVPGQGKDAIRSSVNGPGGLPTPAMTPHLEGSSQTQSEANDDDVRNFDFMICTTHFLGDGMALHRFMNEFFQLIAGQVTVGDSPARERTTEEIEAMLAEEWEKTCGADARAKGMPDLFPLSMEAALPIVPGGKLRRAADDIDFQNTQNKLIGGHAFPRAKGRPRRTAVPTIAFDESRTKTILKTCKAHGVSIANAIFALSALSWSRMRPSAGELPIMMYTALNLRPYLLASATAGRSYWFTAIGYLNIVLPAFLPSASASSAADSSTEAEEKPAPGPAPSGFAVERTLWHRARVAKAQISSAAKNPLLVSRTHAMARVRGERARKWAAEDDAKAAGTYVPPPKPAPALPAPTATPKSDATSSTSPTTLPKAPSTALLGLSMLGNLDGTPYVHASFPSLRLHTLTTGSRQRPGAMLLFGYTFAGKLWLSLGYDVHGYEEGVVERWWEGVLGGVEEFLVPA